MERHRGSGPVGPVEEGVSRPSATRRSGPVVRGSSRRETVGPALDEAAHQLPPVHDRHRDVGDDEVGQRLDGPLEPVLSITRLGHRDALVAQDPRVTQTGGAIVVDQEHQRWRPHRRVASSRATTRQQRGATRQPPSRRRLRRPSSPFTPSGDHRARRPHPGPVTPFDDLARPTSAPPPLLRDADDWRGSWLRGRCRSTSSRS